MTALTESVAGSSASPSAYMPLKAATPVFVSFAGMSLKTMAPPSPWPGRTDDRSSWVNSVGRERVQGEGGAEGGSGGDGCGEGYGAAGCCPCCDSW